jgi:Na+-transporting NADH:ubiquinone oxidoreductase subunit NqrA
MKTTTIILLITLFPITCSANGKIAAIKKGQRAPFSGILLDKSAEATMTAKRESAVKICEMNKDFSIKKITAECNFEEKV